MEDFPFESLFVGIPLRLIIRPAMASRDRSRSPPRPSAAPAVLPRPSSSIRPSSSVINPEVAALRIELNEKNKKIAELEMKIAALENRPPATPVLPQVTLDALSIVLKQGQLHRVRDLEAQVTKLKEMKRSELVNMTRGDFMQEFKKIYKLNAVALFDQRPEMYEWPLHKWIYETSRALMTQHGDEYNVAIDDGYMPYLLEDEQFYSEPLFHQRDMLP